MWRARAAYEIKLLKVIRQKRRLGQGGEGVGHRRESTGPCLGSECCSSLRH